MATDFARDALVFPVPNGGGEIGPVRSWHRERRRPRWLPVSREK
nr:MAG TPA: hypothetical protein [Bacteriophage sp.]